MGFFKTLTVASIGYVLGARAGRGRYEQIKSGAHRLWESGSVRKGRDKVRTQAAEAFSQAQGAASAKFHQAASAVKGAVSGDDDGEVDEIVVEEYRFEPRD